MTNAREIMAAVFDESPILLLTGEEWADAALAALTAAGFEVRRRVDREKIAKAICFGLQEYERKRPVDPNDPEEWENLHDMHKDEMRFVADAVLAVIDEGQEP